MSRLTCAAGVAHIAALIGILPLASLAGTPTSVELARCARIAAPDTRLACYDTLAGRSVDGVGPASAATSASSATPTSTTPAAAPTPTSDPRNFGFTPAQVHAAPEGPAVIQARITKIADSSGGRAYVVLDNGQTWTLTDADLDLRVGPGDPVTIKRGSLGSFLLVTQAKRSYHVRRMQ